MQHLFDVFIESVLLYTLQKSHSDIATTSKNMHVITTASTYGFETVCLDNKRWESMPAQRIDQCPCVFIVLA